MVRGTRGVRGALEGGRVWTKLPRWEPRAETQRRQAGSWEQRWRAQGRGLWLLPSEGARQEHQGFRSEEASYGPQCLGARSPGRKAATPQGPVAWVVGPRGRETRSSPQRAGGGQGCGPAPQSESWGQILPPPPRALPSPWKGLPAPCVSECVRARGVLRKGRFPFQWGYFWLCCAVTVETARARFSVETSFSRAMYTEQAARKPPPLPPVGCECCLPLPAHPSPLSLPGLPFF